MSNQDFVVEETAGVGAFVSGIDLRTINDAVLVQLKDAFAQYGLLFFRDQQLSPQDHIAFARRWGPININRFFAPVAGYPQIAQVLKEPEQRANIGDGWHTDHSYDQIPALGSLLYARETPPQGGDTLFANTCSAYDGLSQALKKTLSGLQAVHSSAHVFGEQSGHAEELAERLGNYSPAAQQDAIHPVVITHPLSGRKSLYVNPSFTLRIQGWSAEDSTSLLTELYAQVSRPEFSFRLRWAPGTLAFWDNRATWHWAMNDYHGYRRLMHRITLEGVPLEA
ncbi:MAG: TauD/TfdA family dioxygenase [Gammaproteobacteria bacterium]|nr:TauD/TfdA family dioxygenase [Gammaproteobacteria bacterium]MCH1550264.1 TauD/TfdA family dioxygenase [Pseudomonadales bacterium]